MQESFIVLDENISGISYSTVEGATKSAAQIVRTTGKSKAVWRRVAIITAGEPKVETVGAYRVDG